MKKLIVSYIVGFSMLISSMANSTDEEILQEAGRMGVSVVDLGERFNRDQLQSTFDRTKRHISHLCENTPDKTLGSIYPIFKIALAVDLNHGHQHLDVAGVRAIVSASYQRGALSFNMLRLLSLDPKREDYLSILQELFIRFYHGSTREPKHLEAQEAKFIAKQLIAQGCAVEIVKSTFPDLFVENLGCQGSE